MGSPNGKTVSWLDFKRDIQRYSSMELSKRRTFIFRGHGDSRWKLNSTLDRIKPDISDSERDHLLRDILTDFNKETIALGVDGFDPPADPIGWETLARHHGLPTTMIDWTESPYVAAYFAFSSIPKSGAKHASVWCLSLAAFGKDSPDYRLIRWDENIGIPKRMIEQRGLLLKINSNIRAMEESLSANLYRWNLPISDRDLAMNDLDEMLVNSRKLMLDIDGAAETVQFRHGLTHRSTDHE